MSGFFVTVQIGSETKLVEITKYSTSINFEYEDYVYSALQDSDIKLEDFDCFLNVHGARIEEHILARYMEQYIHTRCACLILKVKTKVVLNLDIDENVPIYSEELNASSELYNIIKLTDAKPTHIIEGGLKRTNATIGYNLIVTSESIKAYLSKKAGGSEILSHFEETGYLRDAHRRKIVSYSASFLQENFGFTPSREEQLAVAGACTQLFPSIKLEVLINSTNTGFLQSKLRNDRVKKRKIGKDFEATPNLQPVNTPVIDREIVQKDLHILKSASLPEELHLVKEKLKQTLEFRKLEIKKENFSIYDECRYLFVCPELITYEFTLRFGETPNIEAAWEVYQNHIFTIVKNSGKNVLYTELDRNIDWNTQTLSFLNLLRMLPPSPAGRVKFNRKTDEHAVNNLLIHKQIGLSNEEYLSNTSEKAPYIIAIGKSKADIDQYLIVIDGNLIPLTNNFKFIDALDLVYKLHFLFDIKYDNNLRLLWCFLQNYLYNMHVINLPATIQDLYGKFTSRTN